MSKQPEKFTPSDPRIDNIRQELDGKIEKKVSIQVFMWVLGGLAAATLAAFIWLASCIIEIKEKIAKIETKIEMMQNKK